VKPDPFTASLAVFAARHKLPTVQPMGNDERYIKGRDGLITEYSPSHLHLVLSPGTGDARWWHSRSRAGVRTGMVLDQDGDSEGSLIFDPSDAKQARLAIKLSGARPSRKKAVANPANRGLTQRKVPHLPLESTIAL